MIIHASLLALTLLAQDPVGRTFRYERTNHDGSLPEQIYFHRSAPDRIEVYKMVERCTRSALVTATIDPATGQASRLEAARLQPHAARETYGELVDDRASARIVARLKGNAADFSAPVGERPWHLYDYDLATLSAAFEARAGDRADYRFGVALVWPDNAEPERPLRWLGGATARFVAAERHLDRDTLRFDVSGPAFGEAGGGPLWVDARGGQLVDVQWGRPNHTGYKDFRLRLVGEEPAGEAAWTALLERHFEGCPG